MLRTLATALFGWMPENFKLREAVSSRRFYVILQNFFTFDGLVISGFQVFEASSVTGKNQTVQDAAPVLYSAQPTADYQHDQSSENEHRLGV